MQEHGIAFEFAGAILRKMPRDLCVPVMDKYIQKPELLIPILRRLGPSHRRVIIRMSHFVSTKELIISQEFLVSDWPLILSTLPVPIDPDETEVSGDLLCFYRQMKNPEIISYLDSIGYRLATLRELVFFSAQKGFPRKSDVTILQYPSECGPSPGFTISHWKSGRYLEACPEDQIHSPKTLFLVVPR